MRRSHAEEQVHGGGEGQCSEGGGGGRECARPLPAPRDQPGALYTWKRKYAGIGACDAKRLKQLEGENWQLKRVVADQALNIQVLNDVLGNKY